LYSKYTLTYLGNHTKNRSNVFFIRSTLHADSLRLKRSVVAVGIINRKHHTEATNQLGYYLAGLIEGDGSIILRKGDRETISPKFVFTFHSNEIPMYQKLQQVLGSGVIYKEKSGICRYSITNSDEVIRVINMVNGKFRTPKIQALYKAMDNLNTWRNANLLKLPLDTSSLDSNAWLAGMLDTDGNFSIKLTGSYGSDDSEVRGRVRCVFSLAQSKLNRVTEESNSPFMTDISNFFQVNLNAKVVKSTGPEFKKPIYEALVFYAQSDSKHYITTSYLTKFPLMTSKYLNYLDFFKGLSYLGKRLTDKEIREVRIIKNSMNNQRTEFNWDHLNSFYSK